MMLNRCEEWFAEAVPATVRTYFWSRCGEGYLFVATHDDQIYTFPCDAASRTKVLRWVVKVAANPFVNFDYEDAAKVTKQIRDNVPDTGMYTVPWQLPAEFIEDHRGEGSGLGLAVVGSLVFWSVIVGLILWK